MTTTSEGSILTVGHSNIPFGTFADNLRKNGVGLIVDVRSHPRSRYTVQFNASEIERSLRDGGMGYEYMGEELGGRPQSDAFYDEAGYVRYDALADSDLFLRGITHLRGVARPSPGGGDVQRGGPRRLPPVSPGGQGAGRPRLRGGAYPPRWSHRASGRGDPESPAERRRRYAVEPPSGSGEAVAKRTAYSIGFTKRSAEEFFGALKRAGVERLIDVRLNNVSQLAGFTKRDDLAYFLPRHLWHRVRPRTPVRADSRTARRLSEAAHPMGGVRNGIPQADERTPD